MQLTPIIAIHLSAALGALAIGPLALWARKGRTRRPRLHRAFGYAWVTLMLATAISALFIRDFQLPNINGYTPIHLLVPVTFIGLFGAFWFLARRNIEGHSKTMQALYVGACLVAGGFTLLPGRYLGDLVWGQWLGLTAASFAPPQGAPMVVQIVANTPLWVWGLLVALLALGLSQTRARSVGLSRIVMLPLAMGGLSLYGTVAAFGSSAPVLVSWLVAMGLTLFAVSRLATPVGVRYAADSRQFWLPGSWVPMALIMGIFLTKYAVGASLAMQPALRFDTSFTLAAVTLYGVFSGIFAGRTVRLLQLAKRPAAFSAPAFNA